MNDPRKKPTLIRILLLTVILTLSMAGVWWLINWSLTGALSTVMVSEGNVATQDVMSPYAVTYQSEVLTEIKQQEAADAVELIYTRADFAIARQQLNQLREALSFIDSVRQDQFSSQDQKYTDLAALEGIYISQDTAEQILTFSDLRWQTVRQEAVVILEQVMRNDIREIDLEEFQRLKDQLLEKRLFRQKCV